jgi:xylose isomerase
LWTIDWQARDMFGEATRPVLAGVEAVHKLVGHEHMASLNYTHGIAQALWAGKLFHIDLNGQVPGKYDQDFRFASEGIRDAFYLVKLLEDAGYDGMRHFDAHPYRTEDASGVWEFAAGCMRTYLILKEKAARMRDDADIQEALLAAKTDRLAEATGPLDAVRAADLDEDTLASQGYGHERLDQLVTELLLGVR